MNATSIHHLINFATAMQKKALCFYSKFQVGVCLQTMHGTLIGGFNIESASYSLTLCAERVAICSALAQGHTIFTHLVLVTDSGSFPCGACRQMIYEFCPQTQIIIATPSKIIKITTAQELMPYAFCNTDLELLTKD